MIRIAGSLLFGAVAGVIVFKGYPPLLHFMLVVVTAHLFVMVLNPHLGTTLHRFPTLLCLLIGFSYSTWHMDKRDVQGFIALIYGFVMLVDRIAQRRAGASSTSTTPTDGRLPEH